MSSLQAKLTRLERTVADAPRDIENIVKNLETLKTLSDELGHLYIASLQASPADKHGRDREAIDFRKGVQDAKRICDVAVGKFLIDLTEQKRRRTKTGQRRDLLTFTRLGFSRDGRGHRLWRTPKSPGWRFSESLRGIRPRRRGLRRPPVATALEAAKAAWHEQRC